MQTVPDIGAPVPARADAPRRPDEVLRARETRAVRLALLLPAAGVLALAFSSGGFFAGTTGTAAVVAGVALAVRAALARRPFEGVGHVAAATILALSAFGAWTFASAAWSDAPARAIVEGDRVVLYLFVLILVASLPRVRDTAGTVATALAAVIVVVAGAALLSRTLPDVVPAPTDVGFERLNYPLTYWNALGLLCAMGLVLCLHFAAAGARTASRAVGAAMCPILAATLVLTLSRASLALAALAVVAYAVLARPAGLVGALLTCGPAVGVTVYTALAAERLTEAAYASAAGRTQGRELLLVVVAAAAGAAALRPVLGRLDRAIGTAMRAPRNRRLAAGAVIVLAVAGTGAAVAAGAVHEVRQRVDEFGDVADPDAGGPPTRSRLLSASGTNRPALWRVSRASFSKHELLGTGAGTFTLEWNQHRPPDAVFDAVDGHSLYLEVLGELGLPGLLLLLLALGIPLVVLARNSRGPDRAAWAVLAVVSGVWAIHAGMDWDWEMPAVTLVFFACAGAAVARRREAVGAPATATGMWPRAAAVAVCGGLALLPLQVARSERHLDRGAQALERGDCARGVAEARTAQRLLPLRPQPHEVLGLCLARLGDPTGSIDALRAAVRRDPRNWEVHYELAIVQALAGRDPRRQAAIALRLNPLHRDSNQAVDHFAMSRRPAVWRVEAAKLPIPGLGVEADPAVAGGP